MLNKQEKEKIGKVLEKTQKVNSELRDIMGHLLENREKAQKDLSTVSTLSFRIDLLEGELAELISEKNGDAPGA